MSLIVKKQELHAFHSRWRAKANAYASDKLSDYFDRFFTLFVIYNRIYNVVVAIQNEQGDLDALRASGKIGAREPSDNKAATICVAHFLKNDLAQIMHDNHERIDLFKFIIEANIFNIDLNYGQPQPAKDAALLAGLNSTNNLKKLEALLTILYNIRCNVFHAEKGYNNEQKEILGPCNECLQYLVDLLIAKVLQAPQ